MVRQKEALVFFICINGSEVAVQFGGWHPIADILASWVGQL